MGFELKLRKHGLLAAIVVALFAGSTRAAEQNAGGKSPHTGHSSAKSAVGVVSLDVYAEAGGARLHLLTADRAAGGEPPRVQYLRSEDAGATWSEPVRVGEGLATPDPVKRGNDAQIVSTGGDGKNLLAVWTSGANTRMGRGPLVAARSEDGGRTWTSAASPSDSRLVIDHAFVDLAADRDGNVHCVWLDGRHGAKPDGTIADDAGKGLRYARSSDGGKTWTPTATLDDQCCECCWNSLLVLPGGIVHVLFRDRDPRDMAMLTSRDGGKTWGEPSAVGAFKWAFSGCPHVGGALTSGDETGEQLSAVVWTAKGGDAVGAFVLSSSDAGKTWSNPQHLGGEQSSRPDVASAGKRVVAAWDEYVDTAEASTNAAFYAISEDAGKTWGKPVRLSPAGASATYPRVVRAPDGFRILWTQKEPGKPGTWTSQVVR